MLIAIAKMILAFVYLAIGIAAVYAIAALIQKIRRRRRRKT